MAAFHDLRDALVRLRRRPAPFLSASGILAVGLAAAMSMLVLLDAVVFHDLPGIADPSHLVYMRQTSSVAAPNNVPLAAIKGLEGQQHSFTAICGLSTGAVFRVERNGVSGLAGMTLVAPACANVLGIRPYLGRLIDSSDDPARGVSAVVVLSYDYWRRAFGSDPSVIGQTLLVQGAPHTIVGVSQPGYKGISSEVASDILLPINYRRLPALDPKRGLTANYVVGRLRPGATIATAQAELDAIWSAVLAATAPPSASPGSPADPTHHVRLEVASLASGLSSIRTRFGTPLMLLSALASVLFLVACMNVAGLVTADATGRRTEFAVRAALGASRARVQRQVSLEAAIVVLAAAIAAVPIAVWITRGVTALVWTGLSPLALSFSPTLAMVASGLGLISVAWLTMTFLPARVAVSAFGHFGSRGVVLATRTPWSRALLAAQIAMAVTMAFGAALLSRSLYRLETIDTGFDVDRVALARAVQAPGGYVNINPTTYYPQLLATAGAIPGVTSAALSHVFPSPLTSPETAFALDGAAPPHSPIALEMVTEHFFATIGLPLREGRDFTSADNNEAPAVAIITESLARSLFPGRSAIGERMRIGSDPRRASVEIVGVAADFRLGDFRQAPQPVAFRPFWQEPSVLQAPIVLVRTPQDPATLLRPLERAIASLKHEYSPAAGTMANQIGNGMTQDRAMAGLSVCFGALAVALSLVGVFAQLTLEVRRRAPEIGVRIALGASARAIRGLVFRDAGWVIAGGLIAGVPLALVAGRAARAVLYEISPADPAALAAVSGLVVILGLGAAIWPARRASRVDPVRALGNTLG